MSLSIPVVTTLDPIRVPPFLSAFFGAMSLTAGANKAGVILSGMFMTLSFSFFVYYCIFASINEEKMAKNFDLVFFWLLFTAMFFAWNLVVFLKLIAHHRFVKEHEAMAMRHVPIPSYDELQPEFLARLPPEYNPQQQDPIVGPAPYMPEVRVY